MLKYKLSRLILLSVIVSIIGAVLINCITFVQVKGTVFERAGALAVGGGFWLTVILQFVLICLASKERKLMEKRKGRDKEISKAKPGIISFCKSKIAMVADIILALAVIAVAVIIVLNVYKAWIIMLCVSILFLSFNMHCILNGKNYRYITKVNKTIESPKSKKGVFAR